MGTYLEDALKWREFVGEYGEPAEVSREEVGDIAPNQVWTLWSRGSDFLVNGKGDGDEVMSYWVTPRPWTQRESSLFVTMTLWVSCPTCEQEMVGDEDWDQDDCDECEGSGVLSIEMADCVDAKTDDDVWAERQA